MKKSLFKGFLVLLAIVSNVALSAASPVHAAHKGTVTFEVVLPGTGWVPADPADVRKAMLADKVWS